MLPPLAVRLPLMDRVVPAVCIKLRFPLELLVSALVVTLPVTEIAPFAVREKEPPLDDVPAIMIPDVLLLFSTTVPLDAFAVKLDAAVLSGAELVPILASAVKLKSGLVIAVPVTLAD